LLRKVATTYGALVSSSEDEDDDGGGGGGDAAAEIAALRAENADLKVELDALDPAFFDEVMEMKRAYHEQSRTLDRYEATLADYAERLGVSFTPARRASGER
jgi:centrosomal protein CEP290